jgi:hypothetical protein
MRPVLAARRKADRSSGRTQTKFELVINLQTAKTMGYEVPAGPGAARLPHLEEGNLWIRATMPPLLAAGSAAYEFHLAAKRSYFHVIADRWCARGGTAREAGRHNRPLVYAVDRCRRSAFVGKGLARSQAKLPRGGRTT